MSRVPSAVRIIGHRGARGHAPENTLLGIDCAIALGCDMVEFDVQRVGDALVLLHDPTLDRTTNGRGLLRDWDLGRLRQLDAGQGQRIPLLGEVLTLVDQRLPLNVEIKSADGTGVLLATQLLAAIQDGWPAEAFLVSSFHHPELDLFHDTAPSIPVAPLLCGVPLDYAACATTLQARALNISAEFADAELIQDAHERGLKVNVYTVNSVDEAHWLCSLGVDGLFSDYPDRLRAALRPE